MPKTIAMNVRLPEAVWEKLDALTKSTRRSKSCLAAEAITACVEATAWQATLIEQRAAEAEAASSTVSHDDVAKWVASWQQGTE